MKFSIESSRKLIISDLDGTLLNGESELSQNTIKTVRKIIEQGHIFCLATGRPKRGSIRYYNQLSLDTMLVNINGAYISNPNDKSVLPINFTFSRDIAREIIFHKEIQTHIRNVVIETVDVEYLMHKPDPAKHDDELLEMFHIDTGPNSTYKIFNKIEDLAMDPNSILLITNSATSIVEIRRIIKRISQTLLVREWSTPSRSFYVVEINSIFATKGTAAKYLSAYYNIPLSDTYAFGDGANDVEMLQKCGISFAMTNGLESVKAIARFETDKRNDDDGVADILKRLFMSK